MDRSLLLGAVLGLGLVALAVMPAGATEPGAFKVYHFDSQELPTEGNATPFRETFRVHWTEGTPVPITDLEMLQDGLPFAVTWQDTDGTVTVGDRFWFDAEVFDARHILEAKWRGRTVMECRYGAGSGLPVEPDEAQRTGQLRCLRTLAFD